MNLPTRLPFPGFNYHPKLEYSEWEYSVYKSTFPMEKQKGKFGRRCREKMKITKMRRNDRALSPIFAVLILIAIAVIAGIIVYMFTSGYLGTMMGGGTTGQEKVAIESVEATTGSVSLWAKSTGGGLVSITDVIIRDTAGNQIGDPITVAVDLPADGTLTEVPVTVTLTAGNTYTAALVSKAGNQFVSPSFKAP